MSAYELERREPDDGVMVQIEVSGELDLTNARDLELQLDEAAPEDMVLVLDLNRVSFVDSAALHVLFKQARRRGQERLAILVEPTAQIAALLAIAGLDQVAFVGPSLESAPQA